MNTICHSQVRRKWASRTNDRARSRDQRCFPRQSRFTWSINLITVSTKVALFLSFSGYLNLLIIFESLSLRRSAAGQSKMSEQMTRYKFCGVRVQEEDLRICRRERMVWCTRCRCTSNSLTYDNRRRLCRFSVSGRAESGRSPARAETCYYVGMRKRRSGDFFCGSGKLLKMSSRIPAAIPRLLFASNKRAVDITSERRDEMAHA